MPLEGNVALVARRRDQLDALADSTGADGGRALVLEADVTDEARDRRIAVNELRSCSRAVVVADTRAPALDGATAWLNSDPLTPADLHGHVVAYDFWTYTCVNWLRTLPYLRAWADRYREHGLIVVGIEVAADWDHVGSPETYLGVSRGQGFVSARNDLRLNRWTRDGTCATRRDSVVLDDGAGSIVYRFRARDVNLVMGSMRGEIPFRVLLDGELPGTSHGADCDADGRGVVSQSRLDQLVRLDDPLDEHTFEITFAAPGVAAFAFTFG